MKTPHEHHAISGADNSDPLTPAGIIDNARKASYWFFAIPCLIILNSALVSQGFHPVMGLGFNDLLQGLPGTAGGFVLTAMPAVVFAVVGLFSFFLRYIPYIAGFILYFLDTLVCVYQEHWMAFGFHVFVLYSLYGGYLRIAEYRAMRRSA